MRGVMNFNADSVLNNAIELHKKGDLAGAIHAYKHVLEFVPQHTGAMNLLGLAYFQSGEAATAVPFLKKALKLRPNLPGADYNLGLVLHALKRYDEALSHFERAVANNPRDAEAHNSLAAVLNSLGRSSDAAAHFESAIELRPNFGIAQFNLAKLLMGFKEFGRATFHFKAAIDQNPKLLEAYFGCAMALRELKQFDESVSVSKEAVTIAPGSIEAICHYGVALQEAGRFREAIEQQKNAIGIDSNYALAHFNLASCYYKVNQYELSLFHYQRALALDLPPELVTKTELILGGTLHVLGRFAEADRIFDDIILKHSQDQHGAVARKSKAVMRLSLGDFSNGWPLYEARFSERGIDARESRKPRWSGDAIAGKLWVWGEQGLGDQILHASMISDLRARVPSMILEIEPRLVDLFARSFPGIRVVAFESDLSDESIEAQIPIGSLGYHLRNHWHAFPKRSSGYLTADSRRALKLRERLASAGQKVVGLSWRSVSGEYGRNKSARLGDFHSVFQIPGVRFVDLQYGDTAEERAQVVDQSGITLTRLEDIDNTNDIDGLAALVSACDAVVTVSNTTAHLAGALGRSTWVFVPFGFAQMWYWFLEKEQSPWYRGVKVRRQLDQEHSWATLISSSVAEISDFILTSKSDFE